MANTHEYEKLYDSVRFRDIASFTEVYGYAGSSGWVMLEGVRFLPKTTSKSIILMMHPASTLQHLPVPGALAAAGLHVLCCASRYPKNDSALIMEKVITDLGAWVRHAKEDLGYENVLLLGWSGGGSLSLFYQAEAENPTITATPAGDPIDIAKADLMQADAVMFIAAHASRARTLTEWMDASVIDELDPDTRDPELDLYDPNNANKPPYSAEFLERYRAAQIARNRKISAWVHDTLTALKNSDSGEVERGFVVHRTMADPRWLDPLVDPNGRKPYWCFLGEPRVVNTGPAGLARFCTLRSWLSQWSYDESPADGVKGAGRISVPFLTIENGADDACPATHAKEIFAAAASADKTMHVIEGANHYYHEQPELMIESVGKVVEWMGDRSYI